MRRSCRYRLARHKEQQRRRWQAACRQQGSDTASAEDDDDGAQAEQAEEPTITRAGRKCRRPSLLNMADPTAGTSPQRRPAACDSGALMHQASVSGVKPAAGNGPACLANGVSAACGSGGVAYHGSARSWGRRVECAQQQQQQPQLWRQPAKPSEQAHALSQHRGSRSIPGRVAQHDEVQARTRHAASTGQMQVRSCIKTCACFAS